MAIAPVRAPAMLAVLLFLHLQSSAIDTAAQEKIVFRHVFDDSVLDVSPKPGEEFSEAVESFHATGRDPYAGDAAAVAAGKALYQNWCQSCHLPDGTGRIGPNLVDNDYFYDRSATDIGLFEVIYAGAAGAMQSFRARMTQDEMLKVIAYLRSMQQGKY